MIGGEERREEREENSAFFFFKKKKYCFFFGGLYKTIVMGNSISKSKKKSSQKSKKRQVSKNVQPRLEVTPVDNEHSVNTTQSVSSILITSSQHAKNNNNNNNNNGSALSQLNPDYPIQKSSDEGHEQDTVGPHDAFGGKVDNPQQHKLLAQSDFWPPKKFNNNMLEVDNDQHQLTVSSMNQLTVNSVMSMQMGVLPIDDYIKRLLDAGYASKVSKQLCLKGSEVNSICRAAMDIFLGQPVKGALFIK